MTSLLVWRDKWVLGIEDLDADHREILTFVNGLIEVGAGHASPLRGSAAPAPDGPIERLQGLIDRLRRHFRVEEAFLKSIAYPGFAAHKCEHSLHLAELVDLQRRLAAARVREIDEGSLIFVKDWFLNHLSDDRQFVRYYFQRFGGAMAETGRSDRVLGHHGPSCGQAGGPVSTPVPGYLPPVSLSRPRSGAARRA